MPTAHFRFASAKGGPVILGLRGLGTCSHGKILQISLKYSRF